MKLRDEACQPSMGVPTKCAETRTELVFGILHRHSRVKVRLGCFGDEGMQVSKGLACKIVQRSVRMASIAY